MDPRRIAIMATMDVLLLTELVFSIWMAVEDMSTVTSTFCMYFVPMCAATVAGARFALKRFAPPLASEEFAPVGIVGPLKGHVTPVKIRN